MLLPFSHHQARVSESSEDSNISSLSQASPFRLTKHKGWKCLYHFAILPQIFCNAKAFDFPRLHLRTRNPCNHWHLEHCIRGGNASDQYMMSYTIYTNNNFNYSNIKRLGWSKTWYPWDSPRHVKIYIVCTYAWISSVSGGCTKDDKYTLAWLSEVLSQDWWEVRLELREGAQHSAQGTTACIFLCYMTCYITCYITGQRNHPFRLDWELQHPRARFAARTLPHRILQDHCRLHQQQGHIPQWILTILRWQVRAAHLQLKLPILSLRKLVTRLYYLQKRES